MAEKNDSQEKTEEPSGRKIASFRAEGQVARSQEITALVSLVAGFGALSAFGGLLMHRLVESTRNALTFDHPQGIEGFSQWAFGSALPVLEVLGWFVLFLLVAGFTSSIMQTGLITAWKSLSPKVSHINPMAGFKKLVSSKALVNFARNVLKMFIIGWIAYGVVQANLSRMLNTAHMPLLEGFAWAISLISELTLKIFAFLAFVAVADFGYQWFSMRKEMRMSLQELKEERKDQEVSEHVRAKVRQAQHERSKRTIQNEVPTADVIVTNPTHYAVALRYHRETDQAPRVVAKGAGELAALIRKLGSEHDVPLYEYPELARALYRKVKVGRMIPLDMYESVAKVLAYIYRLHKRQPRGMEAWQRPV